MVQTVIRSKDFAEQKAELIVGSVVFTPVGVLVNGRLDVNMHQQACKHHAYYREIRICRHDGQFIQAIIQCAKPRSLKSSPISWGVPF